MVTRLRKINPVQFALVTAIIYAILMLVFALLILPFSAIMSSTAGAETPAMRMFGPGMGVAMVIILPLTYFVISFIFGLVGAALYNLVAGLTGGIEVTLVSNVDATAPLGG